MRYTAEPTAEQRAIIERDPADRRPVKVVAGAGTGKTETLANRFAWLAADRGVAPDRILAVTFTNKAAAELETRIRAKLRFAGVGAIERPLWVSTYHSLGVRLLRENPYAAGIPRDVRIEAEVAQERRIARLFDQMFNNECGVTYPALAADRLGALPLSEAGALRDSILVVFRALRGSGLTPDAFAARERDRIDRFYRALPPASAIPAVLPPKGRNAPSIVEAVRSALTAAGWPIAPSTLSLKHENEIAKFYLSDVTRGTLDPEADALLEAERRTVAEFLDIVAAFARLYAEDLASDGCMDYDDLIRGAVGMLTAQDALRDEYARHFEFVVVDEFQDTSPDQMQLIRLLCRYEDDPEVPLNLMVVGDKKQAIYRWRNARRENMDRVFPSDRGAVLPLPHNYRSLDPIVNVANVIGERIEPSDPKLTGTRRANGPSVLFPPPFGEEGGAAADARGRECDWIAEAIQKLVSEGYEGSPCAYEDIAVLIRANGRFEGLRTAFTERGIPYQRSGGTGFFQEPLAQVLLAYLTALARPLDNQAFAAILLQPPLALTDRQVYLLRRSEPESEGEEGWGHSRPRDFYESLLDAAALIPQEAPELPVDRLRQLVDLLDALRRDQCALPLSSLVDKVAERAGLLENLAPYDAAAWPGIRGSLEAVIGQLESENPHAALDELLDTLAIYRENPRLGMPDADDVRAAGVQVLTMHAAKGLQFPVVFVVGMSEGGRSPSGWTYDEEWGILPGSLDDRASALSTLFKRLSGRKDDEEDERQRLWYVAVTRARDLLVVTHANGYRPQAFPYAADLPVPLDDPSWQFQETVVTQTVRTANPDGLAARLAPAIAPAPETFRTSFTALMTLERCPTALYIREVWGLRDDQLDTGRAVPEAGQPDPELEQPDDEGGIISADPERPQAPPGAEMAVGTAVHAAIASYYARPFSQEEDQDLLARLLSSTLGTDPAPADADRALSLFRSFRASNWAALNPALGDVERPVLCRFDQVAPAGHTVLVSGKIDLLDRSEGIGVIDFKTNKRLADDDRAHYAVQAALYERALRAEGIEVTRPARLAHLRPVGAREIELDTRTDIQRRIETYASVRAAGALPERGPNADCERCGYRRLCPKRSAAAVPSL